MWVAGKKNLHWEMVRFPTALSHVLTVTYVGSLFSDAMRIPVIIISCVFFGSVVGCVTVHIMPFHPLYTIQTLHKQCAREVVE